MYIYIYIFFFHLANFHLFHSLTAAQLSAIAAVIVL